MKKTFPSSAYHTIGEDASHAESSVLSVCKEAHIVQINALIGSPQVDILPVVRTIMMCRCLAMTSREELDIMSGLCVLGKRRYFIL